jgi:hypothetical protein
MNRFVFAGVIACMIIFGVADGTALPRFAARMGVKCSSCHIKPSGGGMRRAFGVKYGREVLPVPTWADVDQLGDFTNVIANVLGVGVDFRTLYFYQQIPDTGATAPASSTKNAFWQMQGDLYINLRVTKKINLYLDKGLYSGFEVFGLLNILPARGFIKVGKFVPAYGTRLDDHTSYIRTFTGFSPERGRPELTGLEVGVLPGAFAFMGGFYNAIDGFGSGVGNEKAFLLRGEGIWPIGEELALGVGANAFRRYESGGHTTLYGGMGSFSYGRFVLLGEGDLVRTDQGGSVEKGFVVYAEAHYLLIEGLDLKVTYDFYDPDTERKEGALSRYGVGFEFFPYAGVELRPIYRFVREEPVDVDNDEFQFLVHFYL